MNKINRRETAYQPNNVKNTAPNIFKNQIPPGLHQIHYYEGFLRFKKNLRHTGDRWWRCKKCRKLHFFELWARFLRKLCIDWKNDPQKWIQRGKINYSQYLKPRQHFVHLFCNTVLSIWFLMPNWFKGTLDIKTIYLHFWTI